MHRSHRRPSPWRAASGLAALTACVILACTACERGGQTEDDDDPGGQESAAATSDAATPPSGETGQTAPDGADTPGDTRAAAGSAEPAKLGPQGPSVLLGQAPEGRKLQDLSDDAGEGALLVAIDTPYQIFEGQGTYVHVGAWQTDGAPAQDAAVFVGQVEVGRTDEHGSLVFVYPPRESDRKDALGASGITVVDPKTKRAGRVGFNPYLRTPSFSGDHLFVYTDRGVYRPGETIHVRAIGWHLKEDYAPLAEAEVEFLLKNAAGDVVAGGKRTTTKDFGIAALDLALPATAPEGLYQLEIAYAQARETARLQVKKFEPPAIQIEHTLGRFLLKDLERLEFDVTLDPVTGGPIEDATLTVRGLHGTNEVLDIELPITGPGPHHIELSPDSLTKLRTGLNEGQFATLKLGVRDAKGRDDEVDRELRYVANPYVAVLETDKDQYSTGDPVEIVAKVSDLDGVPRRNQAVELRLSGGLTKTLETTTDDKGTAQFSLEMPASGVQAELWLDDVSQAVARTSLNWVTPRAMVSHIPSPIIQERGTAEVVVRFPAGIVPVERVVHMDVIDTSGALVNAVLLPIEQTPDGLVARGTFDSPSWGSMLLTFFALGRPADKEPASDHPEQVIGLLTEGQNLVVHPNRTLTITLDGVPDEAAPGSELAATVQVRNPQGEAVDASVGVALVDSRILSLKDPLEITPMDRFYNPELRTMSTTGSKILSWPVVSRNWGSHRHDIALPPFPFKEGGPITTVDLARGGADDMGGGEGATAAEPMEVMEEEAADAPAPPMDPSGAVDLLQDTAKTQASTPRRREHGGQDATAAADPPPTITIRTQFPDTALWLPHLQARAGQAQLAAILPDAIAGQEFILVASDAAGGVGVLRKEVDVRQPLFATLDLPSVLRVGERVEAPLFVTNGTDAAATVALSGSGTGVTLDFGDASNIELEAGASTAVMVAVTPTAVGSSKIQVKASAPSHEDLVVREVRVEPPGAPAIGLARGAATKDAPFSTRWTVPQGALANDAVVRVGMPAITAGLVGLDTLSSRLSEDPFWLASDLTSAALVLQYAARHDLSSPQLDEVRSAVQLAAAILPELQSPTGGWSFWRNGASSPYVTAWVVEGLLEAKAADIAIDDRVLVRASQWLVQQIQPDGLVRVDDIGWWEGDSQAVRLGLTAEIFDVLTRIPPATRGDAVDAELERLATTLGEALGAERPEPLMAAHALQGLTRLNKIDAAAARPILDQMLAARDRNHWEPSWFHAYGGRLEATVAVLEAMQTIDPSGLQAEKRDALKWILSTRDAWGTWHNERGTAAAIRALLLVGAPPGDIEGTVEVKLDGKTVQRVELDPSDPFLSAVALNHLDVGQALAAGDHELTVELTGTSLEPTVEVVTRTWQKPAGTALQSTDGTELSVAAPDTLTSGDTGALEITVRPPSDVERATVLLVAHHGLVEPDLATLDAALTKLQGHRRVTADGLRIELPLESGESTTLEVPFQAARRGQAPWPSVSLVADDGSTATVGGAPLTVE